MANEIQIPYQSGKVVFFFVFSKTGTVWNVTNSAMEVYATANFAQYKISATEQGSASKVYMGSFPSSIPAGVYGIIAREQLGGAPVETDPLIATGEEQWNGSSTLPLSDLASSGQI